MIVEVNKDNFNKEVLEYPSKVLVDFNASWCGPCKMLRPILEELAESNKKVKIVSVNVDDEEELSEKFNIYSIPCLILFNVGVEIKRNIGLISKEEIERIIEG